MIRIYTNQSDDWRRYLSHIITFRERLFQLSGIERKKDDLAALTRIVEKAADPVTAGLRLLESWREATAAGQATQRLELTADERSRLYALLYYGPDLENQRLTHGLNYGGKQCEFNFPLNPEKPLKCVFLEDGDVLSIAVWKQFQNLSAAAHAAAFVQAGLPVQDITIGSETRPCLILEDITGDDLLSHLLAIGRFVHAMRTGEEPTGSAAPTATALVVSKSPEVDQLAQLLLDRRQLILYGPPGTGKTWRARMLAQVLLGDDDA